MADPVVEQGIEKTGRYEWTGKKEETEAEIVTVEDRPSTRWPHRDFPGKILPFRREFLVMGPPDGYTRAGELINP
jgi:hypothetical protein